MRRVYFLHRRAVLSVVFTPLETHVARNPAVFAHSASRPCPVFMLLYMYFHATNIREPLQSDSMTLCSLPQPLNFLGPSNARSLMKFSFVYLVHPVKGLIIYPNVRQSVVLHLSRRARARLRLSIGTSS